MALADFLSDLPLLHSWDGNLTWNTGGFDRWHVETLYTFLRANLEAKPMLLETGAGLSTMTLLYTDPLKLISIAPDPDLFERIRLSCKTFGLSDAPLEDYADGSQWVLPQLAASNRSKNPYLDFVLIDGCHGWPTAFVDLEYSNHLLKMGGYLMVDDVQLHSLKEMARLLSNHPVFELRLDLGKALVFKKILPERHLGDFCDQPYIVAKTDEYARQPNQFALQPPRFAVAIKHAIRCLPKRIATQVVHRKQIRN